MICRIHFLAITLAAAFTGAAYGQIPSGAGAVSGTGTGEIERPAQVMRLRIVITTQGKDLNEALASLKDRLTAAKTQVAALGATKDSIKTEEPQIAAENSDRRRQMEMLMAQRMRGGRRPAAKKEEVKPPVSVSTTLTAEWPLKGEADGLLLAAHALQEKIKAADLAGLKEQSKLSPEEQELSEELAGEMAMYSSDDGPKPGEPMFLFAAPITTEEREKLLAEGFQKAKENASRLAKAAGAELGALRNLADSQSEVSDEMYLNNPYGGNSAYRMMQMMQAARGNAPQEASEAIGVQPGKLTYRVIVTASFELKSK